MTDRPSGYIRDADSNKKREQLMIKKVMAALVVLCFPGMAIADCSPYPGLSAPTESMDNFVSKPSAICLDGKDITSKIKQSEDEVLTSASGIGKNIDFLYVGLYSAEHHVGRIIAVYQLNDGRVQMRNIVENNPNYAELPKNTFKNISINYYDRNTATLYFSTDAWATSRAIHYISFPANGSTQGDENFLTAGSFKGVSGNKVIVEKIDHDDHGAFFPVVLVDRKGNVFCNVDTNDSGWNIDPQCLPKGVVLKPR
ncbi:UNVERIFIED_ORG: hypothetical protein M2414_002376 [Rahnella aquatilis]